MAERRCSFQSHVLSPCRWPSQPVRISLQEVVIEGDYRKWGKVWATKGLVFVEHVVSADGLRLRSEQDLDPIPRRTTTSHSWYKALTKALCSGPQRLLRQEILVKLAIVLSLEEANPGSRYLRTNKTTTLEAMGFGAAAPQDSLQKLRDLCPPTELWQGQLAGVGQLEEAVPCSLATLYPTSFLNWPGDVQQRPPWITPAAQLELPNVQPQANGDTPNWLAFSDGSLKDSRSATARAGGGVAFIGPGEPTTELSFSLQDARSSASVMCGRARESKRQTKGDKDSSILEGI